MKGRYLISTLTEFPTLKDPQGKVLPEVVLAGRSNVGKSSLINHLLAQPKLARTSATPGKTQLINFFMIDDAFLLVDLPGYGFAKAPKETVALWSQSIDRYLETRKEISLLLLLVDCRRGMEKEEEALAAWAKKKNIPLLLIFTKTDKLSRSELVNFMKMNPGAIFFSVKSSKEPLEKSIRQILWG